MIILGADATQSQVQRLLGVGAREYLTKPLDVGRFLKAIERQLEASGGGAVDQAQ